jgi:hypothetical protein
VSRREQIDHHANDWSTGITSVPGWDVCRCTGRLTGPSALNVRARRRGDRPRCRVLARASRYTNSRRQGGPVRPRRGGHPGAQGTRPRVSHGLCTPAEREWRSPGAHGCARQRGRRSSGCPGVHGSGVDERPRTLEHRSVLRGLNARSSSIFGDYFERAPFAYFVTTTATHITYANSATCTLCRRSKNALVRKPAGVFHYAGEARGISVKWRGAAAPVNGVATWPVALLPIGTRDVIRCRVRVGFVEGRSPRAPASALLELFGGDR